jgi:hypothetical protein
VVVFVVVGTLTKGNISTIATSIAGILLIYLAGTILFYIIRSPAKKNNDTGL